MKTFNTDDSFLSYYQLDHDPFASRVPNFKFFTAQRKTILGQLHHLARHSQLMLVITGPKNSGKTLLRQALIASVNKELVKVISLAITDCVDVATVLNILADELQIEEATPAAVIEQIKQLEVKGINFYVMVDDAEQLSDDLLQLFLNLASEQLPELHLFLFAKNSLLERLEASTVAKEMTFNLPLMPYSFEETKQYIVERLEGAGQDISLFTEDQLFDIYKKSTGWPGVINQVASDYLKENMQGHQFSVDLEDRPDDVDTTNKVPKIKLPKKHLIIAGGVAVAIIALLFITSKPAQSPDTTVVAIPPSSTPATTTQNQTIQNIPLSSDTVATNQTTQTTPLSPPPIETTNHQQPVLDNPPLQPIANDAIVNQTTETGQVTQVNQPVQATPVISKTEPTKPVATPTVPPATKVGVNNAWYHNQEGGRFTIQVSATGTEKAAREFIAKQRGDYHYFKRTRAGKVDYVITSGAFAKRSDAQEAIKKLPIDIQQSKPWPRTFASIKQELAK